MRFLLLIFAIVFKIVYDDGDLFYFNGTIPTTHPSQHTKCVHDTMQPIPQSQSE